jgi:branched-chain amino acid transport system substrate-binding protein
MRAGLRARSRPPIKKARQRRDREGRSAVPDDLQSSRRRLLQGTARLVAAAAIGAPALIKAQNDRIRFGHLTPRTGFLGPLGEYAVMGVQLAVEEINKAGGVTGRRIELIAEDSVNPSTASTKAQRLLERDGCQIIIGEISSASGLAIAQVALRNKKIFVNTGCNSDELRGKSCNRYLFHTESANSMYVKAVGRALLREKRVKDKRWYSLTADYAFGHDLLRVAKRFMQEHGGQFAADELVPTDATDFSPYLLKIRQAKPDLVVSNLAGNQITNFLKQYSEYGLRFPVAGFGFDTAVAWGAGEDTFGGIWPVVWHHDVKTPSAEAFVKAFSAKYGKPPENQAWGDYVSTKIFAQVMNELKTTDTARIIEHLEKQPQFDILKARRGFYRSWDHQLMDEMYTMTKKPKGKWDKWNWLALSAPVPDSNESLEVIGPTREENPCTLAT